MIFVGIFDEAESLKLGFKRMTPLLPAVITFGIVLGFTGAKGGLDLMVVSGTSFIIFAGSAQFITLILLIESELLYSVVVAAIILNLRHIIYGAGMNKILKISNWKKALWGYFLTDEAFLVTHLVKRDMEDDPKAFQSIKIEYVYLAAGFTLWAFWNTFTIVGYLLFDVFSDLADIPSNFFLATTFLGYLVDQFLKNPQERPLFYFTASVAIFLGMVASTSTMLILVMISGGIFAMINNYRYSKNTLGGETND